MNEDHTEDLLRELAPQVLGALVRRYGHFDTAEDAVQEALLSAATQWTSDGVPDRPLGWLITVASRRLTDLLRAEQARRRREDTVAARALPEEYLTPPADVATGADDTLTLLFLCCHPELPKPAQIALTLRAVGGLTTAEIAHAFLVPEPTMAQRISRAKQRIKSSGVPFRMPAKADWTNRLGAVLHVLYLIFNESYAATAGPELRRADLSTEAIRLTRAVQRGLPDDGEAAGLLALMLLNDARRDARTDPTGRLLPLAEQERSRWDADAIAEAVALLTDVMARCPLGPYQLQAAIAAVHSEAPRYDDTDWPQILALYELLERLAPGPVVTLNRSVAIAMVRGPRAGLAVLEPLATDARLAHQHRLEATRAHLLEMAGDHAEARTAYRAAADQTASLPERHYLQQRANALDNRTWQV